MSELRYDPRSLGEEVLRRVAEADRLAAHGHRANAYDYGGPTPEWLTLGDGSQVRASQAATYAGHLLRTAELLTQVAQVAATTDGGTRTDTAGHGQQPCDITLMHAPGTQRSGRVRCPMPGRWRPTMNDVTPPAVTG